MLNKVERFEDLIAWQKAQELTRSIYDVTRHGPFASNDGLARQIQRAAVSIMANIAEDFESFPRIIEAALIPIPAGDFLMGCDSAQENEQPVHRVWVSAFAMGKFPVTNREYACFLQAAGWSVPPTWDVPRLNHPDQPVVAVSWFDAEAYCHWLRDVCGRPYRLPTEAEWERAARGGIEGQRYPWGDDLPHWMNPNGRGESGEQPDLVGQDPPNGYGLHNMGDLVHVWCHDWYAADYYHRSPAANPQGPTTGVRRSSRGGSWRHRLKVTRCAARSSLPPDRTFTDYGFRVALSSA